jgi:hypothetical protein
VGRLLGLLGIVLVGAVVAQAFVGAELRELEALGSAASEADLTRATRLFWASAGAIFAVALALGALLVALAIRTIRSATFPPAGAEWIGARRHYEAHCSRRCSPSPRSAGWH